MRSANKPSLTILFPLHKALPWIDIISENIKLCPVDCKIIVSDRTLQDNTIDQLIHKFNSDQRITFLNIIGTAGWREHVNWLLDKVTTDLFSIMPQDDSITPLYYERLVEAFAKNPKTALTFGPITAHNFENNAEAVQFESLPLNTGLRPTWVEAIELERTWNLGIAYRGVIRRNLAKVILPTVRDQAADIIWVFGLALKGYLVEVPNAIYHKRYHSESAHVGWRPLTKRERYIFLRRELIRHLIFQPLRLLYALRFLKKSIKI